MSAQKKNACRSKQYYLAAEEIGCLVFRCGLYKITELNVRATVNSNFCFSFEGESFYLIIFYHQSAWFNL